MTTFREGTPDRSPLDETPNSAKRASRGFLLIFLLSLVLRLLWWGLGPRVIEDEGTYIARAGETLAAGCGYMGIHGFPLLYPPLYSILVATGVQLGLSSEAAGRLVSLLFGVSLPLLVCLIARRLYGTAAAWTGGLLAAAHPFLVVTSAAVLTESTFLTLTMLAVFFYHGFVNLDSRRDAILAGSCLGLAYLCRPEAMMLAAFFSVIAVAVNQRQRSLVLGRTALFLAAFSIFALPFVFFLYSQTGEIHLEAKSPEAIVTAFSEQEGQHWGLTYFAIDCDLKGIGISMVSNLELLKAPCPSLLQVARISLRQAKRNLPWLLRRSGSHTSASL